MQNIQVFSIEPGGSSPERMAVWALFGNFEGPEALTWPDEGGWEVLIERGFRD